MGFLPSIDFDPIQFGIPPNNFFWSETEKAIVKHVFLTSKHLDMLLQQAVKQSCTVFMTVTRLGGWLMANGIDIQLPGRIYPNYC